MQELQWSSADSKDVAGAAAEEGGTLGGVVFKVAGEEAKGGTKTKGIAPRNHRVTTFKVITHSKATITIITITMGRAQDLLWDRSRTGVFNKPPTTGVKRPKGIILNSLGEPVLVLMGCVLQAIWVPGTNRYGLGAGETTSLWAPWTFQISTMTRPAVCLM